MGLHHQHLHGRVLRGLEARQHLEMTKRDSHGSEIKMNVPEGFAEKQVANKDDTPIQTVVNVVYITASADFTGAIAGFTTVTSNTTPDSTPTTAANISTTDDLASSATPATSSDDTTSLPLATASSGPESSATASSASSVSSAANTTINNKSLFLNAPASATASATTAVAAAVVAGSPLAATRSAGAQISNTSNAMTGGAKAGLAFGIIIGFALVAGLLFFCWRRRKNPNAPEELNEKRTSSIFGGKEPVERASVTPSVRSTRTASTAPRLSLRPVTQFLPNLNEDRKSAGNLLGIGGASPMAEKPKSTWERRPVGSENPFDDNNEKHDRTVSASANPFDEPEGMIVVNGKRTSADSNGSSTHSKAGSEPSTPNSKVGAGPIASQGPNNVHRVQLDFKPSMEDELELKSGQLVRMLHEYDDGWALCVRMDRSQQGVAPRTCLSKVPVKPRPQGPPNGQRGPPPGIRGPGPQQGPSMMPGALSPASREGNGAPPESSQAPAVARKPVPGQAL